MNNEPQDSTDRREPLHGEISRRSFIARAATVGAIASGTVGLSACGKKAEGIRWSPVEGRIRYPLQIEPTSFDPPLISEVYSSELMQNVFEGLVTLDEKNAVAPAIAESWDVSSDGRVYTFHLRKNALFHNGRPVTAHDVKYSYERALHPKLASPIAANYFAGIQGVEDIVKGKREDLAGLTVLNDHTVRITLDAPMSYFLQMIAYNTGFIVCREAVEKAGGKITPENAVGAGAFRMVEYKPRASVVLEGFSGYYGGAPAIKRIERPIVLDTNTQHAMFENGEVDYTQIAMSDYVVDRDKPLLKAYTQLLNRGQTTYVAFNQTQIPEFKDVRVRKAMAMAIDRTELVRVAFQGVTPLATGFLPPGMLGFDPNLKPISFDAFEAARLLAAAGFPGGKGFPSLVLMYLDKDPQWAAAANLIRNNIQQNLGITIDLQQKDAATYFAETHEKRAPFFIAGWTADFIDPQNFLSTLLRSNAPINRIGYSNAELDKFCDAGDREPDAKKRDELYQAADRIVVEDVPVIPLTHNRRAALMAPHIQGWGDNLVGIMSQTNTKVVIRK